MTENVPTLASVDVPPPELPPLELPPVDVPPELPPVDVPPLELPPAELPPVEVPASPPLALGDSSFDEHPQDEARAIEQIRVGKTEEFMVGVEDTAKTARSEGTRGFCEHSKGCSMQTYPSLSNPGHDIVTVPTLS